MIYNNYNIFICKFLHNYKKNLFGQFSIREYKIYVYIECDKSRTLWSQKYPGQSLRDKLNIFGMKINLLHVAMQIFARRQVVCHCEWLSSCHDVQRDILRCQWNLKILRNLI